MSLVTTCPTCGTVFRMVREQLDASGGWVRCGHCMSVFDANAQLLQTTDSDGASPHAGHSLGEGGAGSTLSFAKQAEAEAFWAKPAVRAALAISCGLLLLILGLQILHSERDRLEQRLPAATAITSRVCQLVTCPPRERRQMESWVIDNSSFQKDTIAAASQAFRLDVQLKNTAHAAVLRPAIELSLLNSSDTLLVRSVLGLDTDIVAAGDERHLSYIITPSITPNANAADIVGYRLVLFYP